MFGATMQTLMSPVNATQGYFTLGNGTVSDRMAGTGVAVPQDAASEACNPASFVRVGNRYELGACLFQPNRK
jgi:long-chain fatty acid transport protein